MSYPLLYLKQYLMKQITSPGWMHETKCSGLVHWEDPEEWDGEGGRRGDWNVEHM